MEDKKVDINSIIGFILIFGILIFMFYQNSPTPEQIEAEKAKNEQIATPETNQTGSQSTLEPANLNLNDSTAVANYQGKIGAFGYTKPSEETITLQNDLVNLEISSKGGQITEARMKQYHTFDSIPVYLIRDGNATFGLKFTTSDNRTIHTKDLYFEPSLSESGENKVLTMKAKTGPDTYLEYRYEMKPDDYMVDFTVRTQGLNGVIKGSDPISLVWQLKGIRHSKSVEYENRYTELTYNNDGGDIDYLSISGDDRESGEDIKWLSFRQHFF